MEPKDIIKGLELELEIKVEELEERIAPGELVWPFLVEKAKAAAAELLSRVVFRRLNQAAA